MKHSAGFLPKAQSRGSPERRGAAPAADPIPRTRLASRGRHRHRAPPSHERSQLLLIVPCPYFLTFYGWKAKNSFHQREKTKGLRVWFWFFFFCDGLEQMSPSILLPARFPECLKAGRTLMDKPTALNASAPNSLHLDCHETEPTGRKC